MTTEEISMPAPPKTPTVKKSAVKKKPVKAKAKAKKPAGKSAVKKKPVKAKAKVKKPLKGRPLQYPDKTMVRMPKGYLKRVNGALKADEPQAEFMRIAVDRELKARRK